jgi:hypothetical protein
MTLSWYSINIVHSDNNNIIFSGYFSVDNTTNLVTGFYETINGTTNLNNNLLLPTEPGIYDNYVIVANNNNPDTIYQVVIDNVTYTFTVVTNNLIFTNLFSGNVINLSIIDDGFHWWQYDNAYLKSWKQFDNGGILLNQISYLQNNNTTNYIGINLHANNFDDEQTTHIGSLGYYTSSSSNPTDINWVTIDVIYTINYLYTTCFKEGTKILTISGYKLIQDLKKGDLVKTLKDNYKAIDMIGKNEIYHLATTDRTKDQLYTCSVEKYSELFEDLVITGCHAILVDKFKDEKQKERTVNIYGGIYVTDNKYRLPACVDDRASVYDKQGTYTIYHFALENDNYYSNYGIYANGLLVETCSKRYLKELSNMTLIE